MCDVVQAANIVVIRRLDCDRSECRLCTSNLGVALGTIFHEALARETLFRARAHPIAARRDIQSERWKL